MEIPTTFTENDDLEELAKRTGHDVAYLQGLLSAAKDMGIPHAQVYVKGNSNE